MQVLYQFDLRGEADRDAILEDIRIDAEADDLGEAAFKLATAAWESHPICDALTTELAPDWPSHRQPPLDRALLRLAHHEITTGRTPAKVAINEAVELAKTFCAERSPAFINGVLDKMVKRLELPSPTDSTTEASAESTESESESASDPATASPPMTDKAWLNDAIDDTAH